MPVRRYGEHRPELGARVYVDPAAVVIGRVIAGDDASFWPMAVVRGDVNEVRIGARTNVQDAAVLHVTHDGPFSPGGIKLVIGADVTVGHGVILHACTIGDRCLIGINACVLDGATVEDDVFVAAGSLVTPGQTLESGSLYRGSPARRVRDLTARNLEMLTYSAAHYVRLKDEYLAAG